MNAPRLLIAAPSSGSGKTTVTLVLLAALKRRGLSAQPFKVGPDYIDPGHLTRVSGRQTRNLDGFFLETEGLRAVLQQGLRGADLALIEGVMGLFDGKDALGRVGSSAAVAKQLQTPVVLVVDAVAMAGSIAALARGFKDHDPALDFAGVIANRVGSERHAAILHEALAAAGIPYFGFVERQAGLELPSRHLGLYQAEEVAVSEKALHAAAQHLDMDALLNVARQAPRLPDSSLTPAQPVTPKVRLGIARDEAFSFYYPENLELLEAAGAELVFFSPLHDAALPEELGGVYLGGGYPERFAATLSQNATMRTALRSFEGVIYAECGGRIYLGETLTVEGQPFEMVGRVPGTASLPSKEARPVLGYREVEALRDSPVVQKGWQVKGHEFHYARSEGGTENLYQAVDTAHREGYADAAVHSSYVHLYFPSTPEVAGRFVESAYNARQTVSKLEVTS